MHNNDTKLIYTRYNSDEFQSKEIRNIEEYLSSTELGVKWLDVIGLDNKSLIADIFNKLELHTLVQEDILDVEHNPKIIDYEDYLYLITKTTEYKNEKLGTTQVSFVVFKDRIITFRELDSEIFADSICRIAELPGLRKNGTDDLMYFLLDVISDNYFTTIEVIGERIDDLEDNLFDNPNKEFLSDIYLIKRQLIFMRSILFHMRNVTGSLSNNEFDLIDGKTIYYLRDLNDQTIQIIDIVDTYRDICSNMLDTYLSSISHKTNEVMKVLTVFSTIFIPLTFLTGVYGMNFVYFPELNWKYSYLAFWIITIILIGFMFRFFKKKGWF